MELLCHSHLLLEGGDALLVQPHDVRLHNLVLCFLQHLLTQFNYRLGLWQRKIVIWTQVGTVIAYLSVMAAIWGHCTPVHKNWQIYPNPGGEFPPDC